MLYITIPGRELFDERTSRFIRTKETRLQLEHSLVSVSKWESKWKKPFFSKNAKTPEETRDYIRCMTITQNVNPNVYYALTPALIKQVTDYIQDPMTATWFRERPQDKNASNQPHSMITSELIYYWMTVANIPMDCEKWHLNRLFTLIRICNEKNGEKPKMSKADRRALIAQRRAASAAKKH